MQKLHRHVSFCLAGKAFDLLDLILRKVKHIPYSFQTAVFKQLKGMSELSGKVFYHCIFKQL